MTTKTIRVAQNCSITFPFDVKGLSGLKDLSTLQSCEVKVGAYTASCPADPSDATKRLVTIEGTGTASVGTVTACVHWTDAAGKADAEPFELVVFAHP